MLEPTIAVARERSLRTAPASCTALTGRHTARPHGHHCTGLTTGRQGSDRVAREHVPPNSALGEALDAVRLPAFHRGPSGAPPPAAGSLMKVSTWIEF